MLFQPFPKLVRLARECIVTEKIDGTNAQVFVEPVDTAHPDGIQAPESAIVLVDGFAISAGSRTRYITPGKNTDNFGFAGWVRDNAHELVKLGPGRHFGEWWGLGIQRGYGLTERRFSLFHTGGLLFKPECVSVAPTLFSGTFDTRTIETTLADLKREGSRAAPGFMDPEGIVVFHTHARVAFKKTFDDGHKEAA